MGQNYGYPNPGQQAVIAKLEQRVAQLEHALNQERAEVARLKGQLEFQVGLNKDQLSEEAHRLRHSAVIERNKQLEAEVARLTATLAHCQGDINWMMNNEKLLNPEVFSYLHAALAGED